jgi:hypothetical protein
VSEVRYYLDEHVSRAIQRGLQQRGIDAVMAVDSGLMGQDDLTHLQFATSQGCVVYTNDADFLVLHADGVPHAGMVYAEVGISVRAAIDGLELVFRVYSAEEMRNRLEYL